MPLHLLIRWWKRRWFYAFRLGLKRPDDAKHGYLQPIREMAWGLPSMSRWRDTRDLMGPAI